MRHNPMLVIVSFVALSGLAYIYDGWAAARFDGIVDSPFYIVGTMAALVLLWFNPGKSGKAYWGIVALCIVAIIATSAIFGSAESPIPPLRFGGGL